MIGGNMEVVGEAANGIEAVEMARLHQPDVVVMDMSMPTMNGVEATRVITAEMPDTHVIGLSIHEKDDGEKGNAKGGSCCLSHKGQPFNRSSSSDPKSNGQDLRARFNQMQKER
jgi:chemotaxis response regulator CheB